MLTINEIAEKAGVSTGTVSRALTGKQDIKRETKLRILQIVQEEGYQPKFVKTNEKVIAIPVKHDFRMSQGYWLKLMEGAYNCSFHYGYDLLLLPYGGGFISEEDFLFTLLERGIRGVILSHEHVSGGLFSELLKGNIKIVTLHQRVDHEHVGWVYYDNYEIMYKAIFTMVEYGYKHLVYIKTAGSSNITIEERNRAFEDAARDFNLEGTVLDRGELTPEKLSATFMYLIRSKDLVPIGILGSNGEFVPHLYKAYQVTGFDPTGRIAVISSDDMEFMEYLNPPVSVTSHPVYELGYQAVENLIGMLNGETPRKIALKPELVIRKSLSPAIH